MGCTCSHLATLTPAHTRQGKVLRLLHASFDCCLCRRESVTVEDIVYAHVLGMDALARGLRNAAALKESGLLEDLIAERYASWHKKGDLGQRIVNGKVSDGRTLAALLDTPVFACTPTVHWGAVVCNY